LKKLKILSAGSVNFLIIFGSLNPFEINIFLTYLTLSSSVDEVHMLGALCQNALFEKAMII